MNWHVNSYEDSDAIQTFELRVEPDDESPSELPYDTLFLSVRTKNEWGQKNEPGGDGVGPNP